MDRSRSAAASARDAAFRRIQSWRRPTTSTPSPAAPAPESVPSVFSAPPQPSPLHLQAPTPGLQPPPPTPPSPTSVRSVEVVHPWPEWIELIEMLTRQRYFEPRRLEELEEEKIAAEVPIDLSGVDEEAQLDFTADWTAMRNAFMNFGHDRFDILKSLSRKDLQVLAGYGCPSTDSKVVFSSKLLRKHVHIDEGDVCSSCDLRNSCSRGYILTKKEEEAQTQDVMRVLLTLGFNHANGTVENKALLKMNSVKTVVRKLIHEVVKLSAVPIDPNLPRPVIKMPPPKVKQPPPPPKRRVGRDDVEMKKGDWLCPKCDFMNFAKNLVCLQCDSKRPKRQLLPGEWECPRCNFLNYRRNMACFHCEHKRPPDEYTEQEMELRNPRPQIQTNRAARIADVADAWNYNFDDNESDGADVAAFELANSTSRGTSASLDSVPNRPIASGIGDTGERDNARSSKEWGRRFIDPRRGTDYSSKSGFDDFDDEEDDVDSYELDMSKGGGASGVSRRNYSDLESSSDSEDSSELNRRKSSRQTKHYLSGSDVNDDLDELSLRSSSDAEFGKKSRGRSSSHRHGRKAFSQLDSDAELLSGSDDDVYGGRRSTRQNILHKPGRRPSRNGMIPESEHDAYSHVGSDDEYRIKSDDWRKSSDCFNLRSPRGPSSNGRHPHRNSLTSYSRDEPSKHSSRYDGESCSRFDSDDDESNSRSFKHSSNFSTGGSRSSVRNERNGGPKKSKRSSSANRLDDDKQRDRRGVRTDRVDRFGGRDRDDRMGRGNNRSTRRNDNRASFSSGHSNTGFGNERFGRKRSRPKS